MVAEIASTFGVDWPHLTAQVISFSIVCALLYWLAYKPVLRMLDERRKQIAQGLANTEKINAALAAIEDQRRQTIAHAQADATRLVAEAVQGLLQRHAVEVATVADRVEMPNLIATIEGDGPGPHLVMNGHMDVYPDGDRELWTRPPLSGELADGLDLVRSDPL